MENFAGGRDQPRWTILAAHFAVVSARIGMVGVPVLTSRGHDVRTGRHMGWEFVRFNLRSVQQLLTNEPVELAPYLFMREVWFDELDPFDQLVTIFDSLFF